MLDLVGNPEDRFSHNEAHMFILKIIWCYDYVCFTCQICKNYFVLANQELLNSYRLLLNTGEMFCNTEVHVLKIHAKKSADICYSMQILFLFVCSLM